VREKESETEREEEKEREREKERKRERGGEREKEREKERERERERERHKSVYPGSSWGVGQTQRNSLKVRSVVKNRVAAHPESWAGVIYGVRPACNLSLKKKKKTSPRKRKLNYIPRETCGPSPSIFTITAAINMPNMASHLFATSYLLSKHSKTSFCR
jgi:hypothetical protein